VYYALRDLLANVRGWNNKMGFEIVEKSAAEAPTTAAGRDRPA
jgi:hypothetical protein